MNKIKNVTKKELLKADYINVGTGETILSELPSLAYVVENTDQVVIDYKSFTIINEEVMSFLEGILPFAEIGRINKLSHNIKSNWNILHNPATDMPYELEELAKDIQYTRDKFHVFMKKMYKASIVYKLKGYWEGVEKTVIVLNPHLAKKTKSINKELLTLFEDLSKPNVQNKIKLLIAKTK